MLAVSVLSTSMIPLIVVSKSEADTISLFSDNSNKKFSKMDMVLLLLITPPIIWSFFSRYELDTINLMICFYAFKICAKVFQKKETIKFLT